jgi:hypothetical protein
MRIARWGAAAGAVLLVSLPIAAQAEVLPAPISQPTSQTNAPSAPSGTTHAAPTPTQPSGSVSNVKSNVKSGGVTHAAPVSNARTRNNGVKGTISRHSLTKTRSRHVKASSTRHNSVNRASSVHSASTVNVPAPSSSAEAYAANILNAIAISHTKASAGSGQATGTANVLELGGNPPASAFGGTVNSGNGSGDLIDTTKLMIPANDLYLAVAPWAASASPGSASSSSSGIADLLVLTLGDTQANPSQSATVKVLQSTSNANWTAGQSTSNATSDGAYVNVAGSSGLTIDLLHSDTSSTTPGSSYLVSINGNQIGSSGQAGGQCALTVPSLVSLSCLTAVGGVAGTLTTGSSQVLGVTLNPGGANAPLNLINSNAASGSGGLLSLPPVSAGSGGQKAAGQAAAAVHNTAAAGHHSLAFTGLDVPMLLGIAVLLMTAGLGIIWLVRRPRTAGIA